MFTGIIETIGVITQIEKEQNNIRLYIQSAISQDCKVDQSVSHNGICLTIEEIVGDIHRVTAIQETIQKTNLASYKQGQLINLERAMQYNARLDGHLAQGHVDAVGQCTQCIQAAGSWEYTFSFPIQFAHLIVEKGSICVNGVSLTAFNITQNTFQVAIIPYTFEHTQFKQLQVQHSVNLEFDILGKYVARIMQTRNAQ